MMKLFKLGTEAAGVGAVSSLLTNLIAYWKMDEVQDTSPPAVTRVDSTGRGNDLTDTFSVAPNASVDGKISKAAHVSTSNQLLKASNDDMRTGDVDFEWAGWVYILSSITDGFIWGKHTSQYTSLEYALRINASKFDFLVRNSANSAYGNKTWSGALSVNTWYFVDVYHDATNNLLGISVNNAAFETAAHSTGVYSHTNPFDFSHGSGGLSCYMDEWGYWKRLLTPAERTSLYNGGTGLSYPF